MLLTPSRKASSGPPLVNLSVTVNSRHERRHSTELVLRENSLMFGKYSLLPGEVEYVVRPPMLFPPRSCHNHYWPCPWFALHVSMITPHRSTAPYALTQPPHVHSIWM